MSLDELKQEMLRLSSQERAVLAHELLLSLDDEKTSSDPEIDRLWAEEAERRYQELVDGKVEAVSLEEALRQARAALR